MREIPTIRAVNFIYFLSFILMMLAGSRLQAINYPAGVILSEILLLAFPALVYLWWKKYPLREALQIRWPGIWQTALSLVMGFGLGLFGNGLMPLIQNIFGYTYPAVPDAVPASWVQAVLLGVGLILIVPVCEEVLFRGVIQSGYTRDGLKAAIIYPALLFAMAQLSPIRFIAILPVSFALGYVVLRSKSILSSILLHIAYNIPSTILLIMSGIKPNQNLEVWRNPLIILSGLYMALFSFWIFERTRKITLVEETGAVFPYDSRYWIGRTWPVLCAIPLAFYVGGRELIKGRMPSLLAQDHLVLQPVNWIRPLRWEYDLLNSTGKPVGYAVCTVIPEGADTRLECSENLLSNPIPQGQIIYGSNRFTQKTFAQWLSSDLRLQYGGTQFTGDQFQYQLGLLQNPDGFKTQLTTSRDPKETYTTIPYDIYMNGEWPWRFSGLPFKSLQSWKIRLFSPMKFSGQIDQHKPSVDYAVVVVQGIERLRISAGAFTAWKVQVDSQAAWYDTNSPHTVLKYSDGIVTYQLQHLP